MKVLMVEDHSFVISGCRQLFAEHKTVAFIDAKTVSEARQLMKLHRPDVTVISLDLSDGCGLDFIRELTARRSKEKVVAFSMAHNPFRAMQVIAYGAKAFVSKHDQPTDLVAAVEAASRGETWLSHNLAQEAALMKVSADGLFSRRAPSETAIKVVPRALPRLTRREKNVLNLIVRGHCATEIASELNISPILVSSDCAAMRRKLNARTTAE
ncbi:MAG: response regulator transcription factor, partial [Proteobacteria bacterium]|nr:response regulator transcription factor [Pseudomonadota bacterium]